MDKTPPTVIEICNCCCRKKNIGTGEAPARMCNCGRADTCIHFKVREYDGGAYIIYAVYTHANGRDLKQVTSDVHRALILEYGPFTETRLLFGHTGRNVG